MKRSIGVVITLYDDYNYLAECIAHLVRATRQHAVHICLCIDESRYDAVARGIVAQLIEHYQLAVELAYNNRGGPSVSRNNGVRRLLATHPELDYLFFMDADNYVSDGDFDVLVSCLDSAPQEIVYTYQDIIKFGETNELIRLDVPFHRWRLLNEFYGETGNLVRAKVFNDGYFFSEGELLARNTGEDVEFFRRLGGHYGGIYCPGTRFHYRTKLIHRDSVYWPKHAELSAWMRDANRELYERTECEFFGSRFFDVVSFADGPIGDLELRDGATARRSQRSLLEVGAGILFMVESAVAFDALRESCLAGVIQTDLFRDHGMIARGYRFHAVDGVDGFKYRRRTTTLAAMGDEQAFQLLTLPANAVPDFPACVAWKAQDLAIEIIEIWSNRAPAMATFRKPRVSAFFEAWQAFERTREARDFAHPNVVKFPNHGDWLQARLRDDWRYLASQRDQLGVGREEDRACA